MALGYLLEPFIQIQNVNGTPIVGAKIYVYNADTTNLATTYNDFEGHLNTNPVITNDLGNATIIADDGIEYDVSVYDANDLLLFTKKYISIDKTSSAGGTTQVTAGYGISVEKVGNTFIVSVDTDLIATKDDLAEKQDKLHGGDNIEITDDNEVNVVGRRELIVERPLRVDRTNNRLKLYFEDDFSDYYKTKQAAVNYGGSPNTYISYIQQNENGEIEATVSNVASLPIAAELIGGDNISLTYNDNNIIIAGRDWTPELNTKVDTSATTGWDITPYTAGSNISIVNHTIVGKNWSTDISNAVAPKLDTSVFSAYSATTDNAISTIANDLSDFSASTTGWDVSPYYAGIDLVKNGHTIGVDTDSRILAGSYNFVAGHSNTANGGSNGAFGQYNTAIGAKNFAVCNFNSIHGNDNFAACTNNSISGDKNFAGGENSVISGNNIAVFGKANSGTGENLFLAGKSNTVSGTGHIVAGSTNKISATGNQNEYSVIIGKNNDISTTGYIHDDYIIGVGNKYTTLGDSDNYVYGRNNTISGRYSNYNYIIGESNKIKPSTNSMYYCTLVGHENEAYGGGWSQYALGYRNKTNAESCCTMVGSDNKFDAVNALYCSIQGNDNTIQSVEDHQDADNRIYHDHIIGSYNTITYNTTATTPYNGNILIGDTNSLTNPHSYNCILGFQNTTTNTGIENSFTIGRTLEPESNKVKIGYENAYIGIDYTNKKLYKSIDGVSADLDTTYTAGANIDITNNTISGKDWSSEIGAKLDKTTYNSFTATADVTAYTAGSNINITNHVVSGKDWSSDISNAVSTKLNTSTFNSFTATADVTPYSAGNGINIANHVVSTKKYKPVAAGQLSSALAENIYTKYMQNSDRFIIQLQKDGSTFKIFIYNHHESGNRTLFVNINGSRVAAISNNSTAKIYETTTDPIYLLLNIQIIAMGVGYDLPIYEYNLVQNNIYYSLYVEHEYEL